MSRLAFEGDIRSCMYLSIMPENIPSVGLFAIFKLLKDGTKAHLQEDLKDKHNGATMAYDMHHALMENFNTEEARAIFVCYAVDMILDIWLHHTTTAE